MIKLIIRPELAKAVVGICWELDPIFVKWCKKRNIKIGRFHEHGVNGHKLDLSSYLLLVDTVEDATLLRLSFPDYIFPLNEKSIAYPHESL